MLNFTAIDFETANSYRGSICAAGYAVVENGVLVKSEARLVRPKELRFDPINISIHGIRPAMVENAPTFDQVWENWILPVLASGVIVAHNAAFDTSVLRYAFQDYGITCPELGYCCTYQMAKAGLPDLGSHRLPTVASSLGINLGQHHDPEKDATAAAQIALTFCSKYEADTLEEALSSLGLNQGKMWHGGWKPCGKKTGKDKQACQISNELSVVSAPKKRGRPPKIKPGVDSVLTAELSGLIQGIIADDRVVLSEAQYLKNWLIDPNKTQVLETPQTKNLLLILSQVLNDGVLDEEEANLVLKVLNDVK